MHTNMHHMNPLTNAGGIRDASSDPWVRKIPLEEGMATHSSILSWRIPWTEGLVGSSPWGCQELHTPERLKSNATIAPVYKVDVCMCYITQSYPTLVAPGDCRRLVSSFHGIFPGKNAEAGCHFLLRGIFLTQGWNPNLLQWQANSFPLFHLGIP